VVDLVRRGRLRPCGQHAAGLWRSDGRLSDPRGRASRPGSLHHDDSPAPPPRSRRSPTPTGDLGPPSRSESVQRARARVTAPSRSGLTRCMRVARGGLEPGIPGQFFMLEAPGRPLPRPMEPLSHAAGRARLPDRSDRPGHAGALRVAARRSAGNPRPARQRLPPRRRAAAARRGRYRVARRSHISPTRSATRPRSSASAVTGTPRRRSSFRNAEVWSSRPSSPRRSRRPRRARLRARSQMLAAVAKLEPAAQLAWEAPMACGYGACYGWRGSRLMERSSGSASRGPCSRRRRLPHERS